MAFPFIFAANFESGSNAEWDSESDTDSILDFPHYSELARWDMANCTPFSGAYCMRIKPAGGTNVATLTEADINIADAGTSYFRFDVWFGSDFDATADDTFALLELQGAAAAVTVSCGARYVAATDVINMGVGGAASGAVPDNFAGLEMKRNTWYTIELAVTIQTGGSGTIDMYITEEGTAASSTADASDSSLTNIVVTDGVFGLQDHLATTTGTILLDNFIQDDGRIYPPRDRFPEEVTLTKSGHVFVGRGKVANVSLLSGAGTDNVLALYDTDIADTNSIWNVGVELKNTANNELVDPAGMPVEFQRGCYVSLSGTNPRALVQIERAQNYSAGAVKRFGLLR